MKFLENVSRAGALLSMAATVWKPALWKPRDKPPAPENKSKVRKDFKIRPLNKENQSGW